MQSTVILRRSPRSNYAAAKMAIVGLTETLALEGKKYNITANVLAPGAASRLTRTVWSEEMMVQFPTSSRPNHQTRLNLFLRK